MLAEGHRENKGWNCCGKEGTMISARAGTWELGRTVCGARYHERSSISKVLFSFALIVASGYVWRFFDPGGLDRHRVRHALSVTVLHVFLPALAFGLIATTAADRSFVAVPFLAAVVTLAGLAAGFLLYRAVPVLNRLPRPALGVLVLSAGFGNVTYLGLPVITETLGREYGSVAILYDLLATTPTLMTLGVFIAARYGNGRSVPFAASIMRVLKLPPLWGVAAGIAVHLFSLPLPPALFDAVTLMGSAVIPVMIFTVGLALDFKDLARLHIAVPAIGIKLIGAPVLAWWTGSQLGLTAGHLQAVTLEGAMPVMVLSLIIADEFDLDVPLAATCVTVSTVASFFTAPMMMRMLF